MSDSRKAIYDDAQTYKALCKRFNEKPKYITWFAHGRKHTALDCYGEHAHSLKERLDEELR